MDNSSQFRVLHLDDDEGLLEEVHSFLAREGVETIPCPKVVDAIDAVDLEPDFAIIDVFLLGEGGSQLSHAFIQEHLVPNGIPYGRMTSAPSSVPEHLAGDWVFDKRVFWQNPSKLVPKLMQSLAADDRKS